MAQQSNFAAFRGWFEANFRSMDFLAPELLGEWKSWVDKVRLDVLIAACGSLARRYAAIRVDDPTKRIEPPTLAMIKTLYYKHERNVRKTEHRECSHCGGNGWLYVVVDKDGRTISVSSPFDYDSVTPRIVLRPCGCSAGQDADPSSPYDWRQRNMMCGVNPDADNHSDAVNGRMYLEKLFLENCRCQPFAL